MIATKTPIKKLFRRYMVEADINSFQELSRITGIDYQRLNNVRMVHPETFRVYEIQALHEILHFSEEDLMTLLTGEN